MTKLTADTITVEIDYGTACLIRDVFLPVNERKMRKADKRVVAAVTAFKMAIANAEILNASCEVKP